jgi:DNA-binding Xre family transcriptional regulator
VYNIIKEVIILPIKFEKLFKLMEEKGLKKYDLRQRGIHAAVMDKLIKNKNVDMKTIEKLCEILNCQPTDIMEYVPDTEKDGKN